MRRKSIGSLFTVGAFGVAFVLAADARAQSTSPPIPPTLRDLEGFVTLFPGASALPAPAAIGLGVRLTYQAISATNGGGAGGGLIQYDIVHADGQQIIGYEHSYADGGAGVYPLATGYVAAPPGLGPLWINPTVLPNAESVANANLSITRSTKTIGTGQSVSVVRFESTTSTGKLVYEFDTSTGLLVFDSIKTSGGDAQLTLVATRTLTFPWPAGRAPNWVRPDTEVRYAGTLATTIPSAGTGKNALTSSIKVVQAGARWSFVAATTTMDGASQGAVPGVTGSLQLVGATWLPTSALAATNLPTTPTTVDTDPLTGATITVARAADGSIRLEQTTAASKTTTDYDARFGVLHRFEQTVQLGTAVRQTTLERTSGGSDLDAASQLPPLPEDPAPAAGAGVGGANSGGAGGSGGGCAASPQPAPAWPVGVLLFALAAVRRVARRRRGDCARTGRTATNTDRR